MTKEQIKKIIAQPKIDIPNTQATFLLIDLAFASYAYDSHKISGVKPDYIASHVDPRHKPNFWQFISEETLEKIGKKLYSNYLRDRDSLNRKIKGHLEYSQLLKKFWQEYKTGKNKKAAFSKFFKNIFPWWSYAMVGEERGRIIETKIISAFAKRHNMDTTKAREIVSVMSHPRENSVLNVERIDFLDLCLAIISNKRYQKLISQKKYSELASILEIKRKINKYLKNNYWFKSNFADAEEITPITLLADVAETAMSKSRGEIKKEAELIYKNFKKIHDEQRRISQKIKLYPEDRKDFEYCRQVIHWIDLRKSWMMQFCHFIFMIVKEVMKEFNLKYDEISYYTGEELFDLVTGGKKVAKKVIEMRQNNKSFSFYSFGEKKRIFFGTEAEELFKIANRNDEKEIGGVVASTGGKKTVRGIARIVLHPSQDKFSKGEILVTSMTRIEFVPLMRHALAIVTDEGGLGCHAAIVSRELGLPCIIGTKNATKILKSGDKVELDMESGKVKILK